MKKWNNEMCILFALLILGFASIMDAGAKPLNLKVPATVKKIVLNNYYTTYQYHDGMLAIQNSETGNWGFINEQGDLVHDFIWSATRIMGTPRFGGDACSVLRIINGKRAWFVIDKSGKNYRISGDVVGVSDYCGGYARAKKQVGRVSKIVFLNNKGQEVFPNLSYPAAIMEQVTEPYPFSEGLARYYDHNKRMFGYINTSGKVVIPVRYNDARDFSEGLAAVKVSTPSGDRWGFIDATGRWVIPAKFSYEPYPFIEGFSSVQKANGTCVAIDKTGESVSMEFDDIRQFHKGYALVHLPGKRFASIIDKKFQIVKQVVDDTRLYAHNRFTYFLDYQNDCCEVDGALLNYEGEEPFQMSSYIYYAMDSRYNKIMHCKTGGDGIKYDGFVDYDGNFIFIFTKDEF